jgi:hypothetical protein
MVCFSSSQVMRMAEVAAEARTRLDPKRAPWIDNMVAAHMRRGVPEGQARMAAAIEYDMSHAPRIAPMAVVEEVGQPARRALAVAVGAEAGAPCEWSHANGGPCQWAVDWLAACGITIARHSIEGMAEGPLFKVLCEIMCEPTVLVDPAQACEVIEVRRKPGDTVGTQLPLTLWRVQPEPDAPLGFRLEAA